MSMAALVTGAGKRLGRAGQMAVMAEFLARGWG